VFRIVGTAGHIDHGKTSLVRALTGCDTDRLPEEKARGISIELGFAALQLPDGTRVGVVDVPGHERFVRTMLAGAHGMDLVLLTIAADDGMMPQTIEHLDIVRLLGVQDLVVVLTKCDIASGARVRDVQSAIAALLGTTPFAGAPIVPVSTVTGAGIADVRAHIDRILASGVTRDEFDWHAGAYVEEHTRGDLHQDQFFRLPVDRVFTVSGHGTVVTGTARGGGVRAGDTVRILPSGQLARVRKIEVHGETTVVASHGQRVALNLTGADLSSVQRGCTIADPRVTKTTRQFDATLDVCHSVERGIRHQQRVRVHVGTAECFGRIALVGGSTVSAGASAYCRIALTGPAVLMRGDRYVIRDETARQTIGGGVVLHPWPTARLRRDEDGLRRMTAFETRSPTEAAAAFVADQEGAPVSLEDMAEFLNRHPAAVRSIAAHTPGLQHLGDDDRSLFVTAENFARLAQQATGMLADFHSRHPLEAGCDIEAVRVGVAPAIEPKTFRVLVQALADSRVLIRDGSRLRLPGHAVVLDEADRDIASHVIGAIRGTPLSPPTLDQLQQVTGIRTSRLGDVLRVLERQQVVVKVGGAFYFLRETIERAREEIVASADAAGTITAATVRNRLGTTRKYTIPLLEYFDRTGLTVRIGDVHRLRQGS
jgi:selenocysteine-specific elongation factor